MPIIKGSSSRFMRRRAYTLPGMREDIPRVKRRVSLVTARTAPRSGFPEGV